MKRTIKRVYIAGPYTSNNPHEVDRNISRAEEAGVAVASLGAYPVIPHTNTAHHAFRDVQTAEFWYQATLESMHTCDAVLMIEGWGASSGAHKERAEAYIHGMPVFYSVRDLRRWLEGEAV